MHLEQDVLAAFAAKSTACINLWCVLRALPLVYQVLHPRLVLINQTARIQKPEERNDVFRLGEARLKLRLEALLKRQTEQFAPVIEYVHSVDEFAREELIDELDWTGKPLRPFGLEQLDRPHLRCVTAFCGASEDGGGGNTRSATT